MKQSRLLALSVSLLCAALASPGSAQIPRLLSPLKPAQIGIAAGPTFPFGNLRDVATTGIGVLGTLVYQSARLPFGVRIDGTYDRFAGKNGHTSPRLSSLTANAVWSRPVAGFASYLIGGGGFYGNSYIPSIFGAVDEQRRFGFNAGVGVNSSVGRHAVFLEARYNEIWLRGMWRNGSSAGYVPVRFGVVF